MKSKFKYGLILVLALLLAKIASYSQQLASSGNPALITQPVVFSVQITAQTPTNTVPTGSVTFTDGAQILGSAPLQSDATAFFTATFTSTGDHSIVANYSGDANFGPSQTPPFLEHVNATDAFSLAATPAVVVQAKGATSSISVTVFAPSSSTNSPVTLSCDQLPPGVKCAFQTSQLTPTTLGANTTLSIESTATAPQAAIATGCQFFGALSALIFFLVFLHHLMNWRQPRYALIPGCVCLCLLLAGCGDTTRILTSTPSGTSTIRILATNGTLTQVSTIALSVK